MTSVGYATLDVIPSFKGLQRELDKGTTGPLRSAGTKGGTLFGDAAGKSAGSRFGTVFKNAAKAGLVGLAAVGAGAIKLTVDAIGAASDLEESTNKVAQVFGDSADKIFRFSETTADALGQTNQQARDAAATFGIFGSAAGLADRKNAKFAKRMTTLASDLASFNNTDPSQAVEALGSALRGESEPIRAYGVMLDEATLKAEALRLGILKPVKDQSKIFAYQTRITELQGVYNDAVKESGKESLDALKAEASLGTARTALQKATEGTLPPLTQQQKLLAAQSEIFKQTDKAQGDFARTSDGLANQQRRLAARFEDAKAKLGVGLLPIMTKAADFLLDKGIPAFERFADWFNEKGIPAIKKFGDKAEIVAGKVKELVDLFVELPGSEKIAALAPLLAGVAAAKLRGGGNGALGATGKALGIAKPVNVFVTNPGFGNGSKGGNGTAVAGAGAPRGADRTPRTRTAAKGGAAVAALGLSFLANPEGTKDVLAGLGKVWGKEFMAEVKYPWTEGPFAPEDGVQSTGDRTKPLRDFYTAGDVAKDTAKKLGIETDVTTEKLKAFYGATGTAKTKVDRLRNSVDLLAEVKIKPKVDTTDIERALEMLALFRLDPKLVSQYPDAKPDVAKAPTSGGGGSTSPRAGVNFNGPINIQAHDYNDFTGQLQKKAQRAGLGGRP